MKNSCQKLNDIAEGYLIDKKYSGLINILKNSTDNIEKIFDDFDVNKDFKNLTIADGSLEMEVHILSRQISKKYKGVPNYFSDSTDYILTFCFLQLLSGLNKVENGKEVYLLFPFLSALMMSKKFSLNDKEWVEIILDIVQYDLDAINDDKEIIPLSYFHKLKEHKFKFISGKNREDYMYKICRLLLMTNELTVSEEKQKREILLYLKMVILSHFEEIKDVLDEETLESYIKFFQGDDYEEKDIEVIWNLLKIYGDKYKKEVILSHEQILNCCVTRKNSYTESDLTVLRDNLNFLGLSDEACDRVISELKRELLKRDKNLKNKTFLAEANIQKERKAYRESIDRRNSIYNDLNKDFDFRTMEPLNYLKEEEIIACVAKFKKLGFKDEDIYKIISRIEAHNKLTSVNVIRYYLENYAKLKYYAEKLVLRDDFNLLDEYFKELFMVNDEDYLFWKKSFEEALDNFLKMIPGGYEYEFKEAKKKLLTLR